VLCGSGFAKPIVWAFQHFRHGRSARRNYDRGDLQRADRDGPAYWIPAVAVPLLLVTHYVTFVLLLRRWEN
jgi:hypothetical protein